MSPFVACDTEPTIKWTPSAFVRGGGRLLKKTPSLLFALLARHHHFCSCSRSLITSCLMRMELMSLSACDHVGRWERSWTNWERLDGTKASRTCQARITMDWTQEASRVAWNPTFVCHCGLDPRVQGECSRGGCNVGHWYGSWRQQHTGRRRSRG